MELEGDTEEGAEMTAEELATEEGDEVTAEGGEADAGKVAELTTGEGKWWAGRVTELAWPEGQGTRKWDNRPQTAPLRSREICQQNTG